MLTRLKRPSILKQLGVTVLLGSFLAYLGFSVVSGQYGIEGRRIIQSKIIDLDIKSAKLQVEIDAYKHRIALLDPQRLDPDILTERARALLSMAHKDDRILMLPDVSRQP